MNAATFGNVEMTYDEMYQSLYTVGAPCTFVEVVVQSCGYKTPAQCPQEEFWGMANTLVLELIECPKGVHSDDFDPDPYDAAADTQTKYIYLVNYKGEGEGWFNFDSVKSRIKGKYISKYNYQR